MKSNKVILLITFITVFIDMFGMSIIIPIFPMLIMPQSIFKVTPIAWSLSDGFIMAGWLMAVFPLAQFVFTPIIGQLSDKYGRKILLMTSITGTIISYMIFAIGINYHSIFLLFFARILDGASGGNIAVAQAVISDITSKKDRAKHFGLIGIALGLGFILGPFIGGILSDNGIYSHFNAVMPFYFAICLSIINLLLIVILLPETLTKKNTSDINLFKPLDNLKQIFINKKITLLIIINFLFNIGFAFFTTFWSIILANKYNFTQNNIGKFYGFIGISIVLAQALVVRRISGVINDVVILRYSLLFTSISILGFYFISKEHISYLYYLMPFLAVFSALTRSFSLSLLSKTAPSDMQGKLMGLNASANALSQALPAILAGYLASLYIDFTILVGSIAVLIAWLLFISQYNTKPAK